MLLEKTEDNYENEKENLNEIEYEKDNLNEMENENINEKEDKLKIRIKKENIKYDNSNNCKNNCIFF